MVREWPSTRVGKVDPDLVELRGKALTPGTMWKAMVRARAVLLGSTAGGGATAGAGAVLFIAVAFDVAVDAANASLSAGPSLAAIPAKEEKA
jgi:hypothetical protein